MTPFVGFAVGAIGKGLADLEVQPIIFRAVFVSMPRSSSEPESARRGRSKPAESGCRMARCCERRSAPRQQVVKLLWPPSWTGITRLHHRLHQLLRRAM